MFKPIIILKKYLYIKPKWKYIRVHTKLIKKSKIEYLKSLIELELQKAEGEKRSNLEGKLEIINLLLK